MSNLKARGIVLKKTKYSESDLILHVLLSSGQKISLIAKGALKSKKRFGGGVLEPTHFIEMTYRASNSQGLATLTEAHLLEGFSFLRDDYERLEAALFAIRIADKVSLEGESENSGLFNVLGNFLRFLQKATNSFEQFKAIFCLKLLFQQGVLEIENWMRPMLKTQFNDLDPSIQHLDLQKIKWCLDTIQHYQVMGA